MVVVYVHWGSELLEWPETRQRTAAAWLVQNGADLIVGHHPHVVQAAECVAGRPVFYSLGNHLFDQKYPAAKQGLIADCRLHGTELGCGGIATMTPPGSAFPQLAQAVDSGATDALKACAVDLLGPSSVGDVSLRGREIDMNGNPQYLIEGTHAGTRIWRSVPMPLVSVQVGKLAGPQGPDYVLTLERRRSTIDGEDGVRPYVYEVGPKGLVARWRGSALAWPLLDAALLPGQDGLLCGLHRRDSFVVLQPDSVGVRTAVYRWNGFGFSGVEDLGAVAACRELFQAER
jgi:poly-gamma-glutamate synthesis protein (capsule biosynthesis protein)